MAVLDSELTTIVSANIENSRGLAHWEDTRGPVQVENLKATNSDLLAVQGCSKRAFSDLQRGLTFQGCQVQPEYAFSGRGIECTGEGTTVMWNPERYQLEKEYICSYYGRDSQGRFVDRPSTVVKLLDKKTNKITVVASVHLLQGDDKSIGLKMLRGVLELMSMIQADTRVLAGDFGRTPEELATLKQIGFHTDGALDPTDVLAAKKHDYVFVQGLGSDQLTSHPPASFDPKGSNHIPVVTQMLLKASQTSSEVSPPSTSSERSSQSQSQEDQMKLALKQGIQALEKRLPPNTLPGQIFRQREHILSKYPQDLRPTVEFTILAALMVAAQGDPQSFIGRLLGYIEHNPQIDPRINRTVLIQQMKELIEHSSKVLSAGGTGELVKKLIPKIVTTALTCGISWQAGLVAMASFYGLQKFTGTPITAKESVQNFLSAFVLGMVNANIGEPAKEVIKETIGTSFPWSWLGSALGSGVKLGFGLGMSGLANGLIDKVI